MLIKYFFSLLFLSFIIPQTGFCQLDTTSNLFQSSVIEVLNQPVKKIVGAEIYSASKKAENIFDAPVAAAVITREEIIQAGALSIMEALRLLPGVIVRETTSGNFDINIRGFNNTPPGSDLYVADNSNSLVMINNRPIFNYFSGGTFWEALPIDINDIERIELVRGPASALYGSNAVTGVINIITKKITKDGFYSSGHIELGTFNTERASASAGFASGTKFQILGSFNSTKRDRINQELYSFRDQRFVNLETDPIGIVNFQTGSVIKGRETLLRKYPQDRISLNKMGFNTFLSYQPNSTFAFDLSAGIEKSYTVRPFAENGFTPLSAMTSSTSYIDFKSQIKNGNLQLSYLFGKQEPGVESIGAEFDLDVIDLQADYNFTLGGLNIKPGLSYKYISYDDTKYFKIIDENRETGVLNGNKNIKILSPSLRLDFQHKGIRLIASGRLENFGIEDEGNIFGEAQVDTSYAYLAYQLAATYKIGAKHLLRISYGQANRGAFFSEIYTNYRDARSQVASEPLPVYLQTMAKGNPNLKLRNSRSLDIGYRFLMSEKLALDLEYFNANMKDYTSLIFDIDTTFNPLLGVLLNPTYTQTNIPAIANQQGLSLSLEYKPLPKLFAKFFITWQKTNIRNFSRSNIDPELDPSGQNNYLSLGEINNLRGTPAFYGGFITNYSFKKFNINFNAYFFSRQELLHISDISVGILDPTLQRPPTIAEVNQKILLNLRFSYRPTKEFSFFINLRNLLNKKSYEYIFTDSTARLVSGGITYQF
jgi:iron complex outermembrane recepter protein